MDWRAVIGRWAWLLVAVVAVVEIVGQFVIRARAASIDDFRAAVAYVRGEWQEGDLLVSAPAWTDPMLRWAATDLISLADAGRSDLAAYERVWELSIRGARATELAAREPVQTIDVGPVTIRRYDQGPSPVLYDFVEHLPEASVSWTQGERTETCRWMQGRAVGGGIYQGAVTPKDRFSCGSGSWQWVGVTVQEDKALLPRQCIWTHPRGPEPVRLTFEDVPRGEQLVFYTGLYHGQERKPYGGPVTMTIKVDGERVGQRWHRAGDGWTRFEVTVPPGSPTSEVSVEVSANEPYHRTFCWSGTVRSGGASEGGA